MHLSTYLVPVASLVKVDKRANKPYVQYSLSLIFRIPFTDVIILIISLDMLRINV